jgi:beta-N-acetylglucosaminidase
LGWDDLEFQFLDVDATDPMEQAQIDQILLSCGVLTVDEARAARGWQPLEKTGGATQ